MGRAGLALRTHLRDRGPFSGERPGGCSEDPRLHRLQADPRRLYLSDKHPCRSVQHRHPVGGASRWAARAIGPAEWGQLWGDRGSRPAWRWRATDHPGRRRAVRVIFPDWCSGSIPGASAPAAWRAAPSAEPVGWTPDTRWRHLSGRAARRHPHRGDRSMAFAIATRGSAAPISRRRALARHEQVCW